MCDQSSQFYHTEDYKAVDLTKSNDVTVTLQSTQAALKDLNLTVSLLNSGLVSLYYNYNDLSQVSKKVFEVPTDVIDTNKTVMDIKTDQLSNYVVITQEANKPISISIKSKAGTQIFSLTGMALQEYYNARVFQVFTEANSKGIMGLGEQVTTDLFVPSGVYSFWSRDAGTPTADGKKPAKNVYGTHPFFMGKATDKKWFGVFTNLAAAQDWYVSNNYGTGVVDISTIAVGGVVDMYFMFGDSPNQVVTNYHNHIVGNPVLTPQWILGWNQCRWGYNSTQALRDVVSNYSYYNLPLDTQWSDIDYLNKYQDFTYDKDHFGDLKDFVDTLHKDNKRYIPILDAGIAQRNDGYDAYKTAKDNDALMKTADGQIFTGRVWPTDAAYPDLTSDAGKNFWKDQLSSLHDQIGFDGLWEDMNEASNFCDGACYPDQLPNSPSKYKLPYYPTGRDLEQKSIQLDVEHSDGFTELDYHSLFGTLEVKTTHDWFNDKGMRSMIIERSAYAGMGKYGSRWLGDNYASAESMGLSVTGVMMHNVFGIPLAGSDICGFGGSTNAELCARWHVVGSFYPFSRNHNDFTSIPQEPWHFKEAYKSQVTYLDIMRNSMRVKYSLVRFYYTQLSLVSANGGAFFKPVFFEFPEDAKAYTNPQYNIMLGNAVKVSVLSDTLGQDKTTYYFPAGTWCDLFSKAAPNCFTTTGEDKEFDSYAYSFNAHIRDGYIVPLQDAHALNVMTTVDL